MVVNGPVKKGHFLNGGSFTMNYMKYLICTAFFGALIGMGLPLYGLLENATFLAAQTALDAFKLQVRTLVVPNASTVQKAGYVNNLMSQPAVANAIALLPEQARMQLMGDVNVLDMQMCADASDTKAGNTYELYNKFSNYCDACATNLNERAAFIAQRRRAGIEIENIAQLNKEFTKLPFVATKPAPQKKYKAPVQNSNDDAEDAGFFDLIGEKGLLKGSLSWVQDNPIKALLFALVVAGTVYGTTAKVKGLWPFNEAPNTGGENK